MLRVLGSPKKLCVGLSRRDLLHVGGLGMFGLGLDRLLELRAAQADVSDAPLASSFGHAKRCIVLYLFGAPSQLETVDMKPHAPLEVRGSMQPIPSAVPGLEVCEHLPNLARVTDRMTVVRSLTHPHPVHGIAYAVTGSVTTDAEVELRPRDPQHHPYFGSIVQYLDERAGRGQLGGAPSNVALPFPLSSQRPGGIRAGPYGSFLGSQYDPVWTEFVGEGTRSVEREFLTFKKTCQDPYLGCTPGSHFRIASTALPAGVTLDRLDRRRNLLEQFDQSRRAWDRTQAAQSQSHFQELAFSMVGSHRTAQALDVREESPEMQDLYGMTLFGQSCLAARRLLEAGTKLVSVFWDEYGLAASGWDTHTKHFPRMTGELLPGLDKAFSALILDLERRGLLDETLIACISCHGRTPKLTDVDGGGRDHWSQAYSAMFAGGGIPGGKIVGSTDKTASEVTDRPVSPKDVLATMYHLLGIDPHTELNDRAGRPTPLVPHGSQVIAEMLA